MIDRERATADGAHQSDANAHRLAADVDGTVSPGPRPCVRTGVDVQSISRFEAIPDAVAEGVRERAFTAAERQYCLGTGDPDQHFAARWAAKEAFRKLLDGVDGLPLASVEVVRRPDGPRLSLDASAREALADALDTRFWDAAVSLSHDRTADVAVGQVFVVGGDAQ